MKKLLPFLLLIFALQLQAQRIDYYPSYNDSWQKLRNIASVVETPANLVAGKKYPVIVYIHGNGDKGPGSQSSLENLHLGIRACSTCVRSNPGLPRVLQQAVDKYQVIVAAPVYSTSSFTPANVIELLDSLVKMYPVDTKRILLGGFSMGGGGVLAAIQNTAIANRLAAAIPIAPVGQGGSYAVVKATDLPVWGFVNSKDADGNPGGYTDSNKIKAAVNSINSLSPRIPAVLTIINASGHGGPDLVFGHTPPRAPGGWHFTNATATVYDWLLSMDSDNPKTPPGYGSTSTTPPVVVPDPQPEVPTGVNPDLNITNGQVITANSFVLDASASTGATSYYWEVNRTQAPWVGHVLQGGTVGGPKKTVTGLTNGTYTVRLTINGNIQSDLRSFTVSIGATRPKKAIAFDGTTITYDDGSTEKGIATFASGIWLLKNAAGQPVEL